MITKDLRARDLRPNTPIPACARDERKSLVLKLQAGFGQVNFARSSGQILHDLDW